MTQIYRMDAIITSVAFLSELVDELVPPTHDIEANACRQVLAITEHG